MILSSVYAASGVSVSLLAAPLVLVLVLVLVLLLFSLTSSFRRKRTEPPGPPVVPLLGNLLQLDLKNPHSTFLELSKKYGSVFSVYLGFRKVVILSGYATVKEALVTFDEAFGGRDAPPIMADTNGGHGVLWSTGDTWKVMRRFVLTKLRDFGMGKRAGEDKITEECQHLVELLKDLQGAPTDIVQPINRAVSNIICSIIYGSRFDDNDPVFTALIDKLNRMNGIVGSARLQLYNLFPLVFKWIPERKEFIELVEANRKQTLSLFSQLKEVFNPDFCRSFVDAYLAHKHNLEKSGITDNHFHDNNLLTTVGNLFAAGTETTTTTLRWGLLFMAKYPEIQDRVQEELRSVLGGRQVRVEDRKVLNFTNAVIHETQRLADILPIALPHKTTRDVHFQGFLIEKGTVVVPLLTSVLKDPSQWEKPHSFHPAHFLDRDGKFTKRDAFMAFSAGRRACLGESLARMELFLFFASLLQRFRFTPPPGVSGQDLDLSPVSGLSIGPPPQRLCAVYYP